MYDLNLQFKEFNVNLTMVNSEVKAMVGENCTGISAGTCVTVHFLEQPEQSVIDAVQAYWDGIDSDSVYASSYKSKDTLEQEKQDKKAVAKSKLIALGLTEDEVAALLG